MALVEEKLPGVSKVRGEFQIREDSALAERLQEEEFEGHFNANVQLRRTARHDVSVAKGLQKEEILDFRQQEGKRREELRRRELEDKAHAEEVAQKLKEEEEIQAAMKMQDELVAKKLQERERKQVEQKKRQELEDARLAKQSSIQEEQAIRERRRKEVELSERAIQRMQKETARPPQRYSSSPSPPPPPYPDEEVDEPVMDETERQALQEAEDERLARELEEEERRKTEAAKRRRQQEDIELARRLQRQESGGRDLDEEDLERMKREKEDMQLAKKLQKMELEEQKRKRREAEMRRQQAARAEVPDGGREDDLQLAKRLQMEEIEAQRRRRREAEMKHLQQQQQQGRDPSVTQSLHQPMRTGRTANSRSPEGDVSPSHTRVADPTQSLPASIHHAPESTNLGRPPPQGHPFNPVSSYMPAQAGVSVTAASTRQRPPQESAQTPGLMSYKRQPDPKGKKSRYSSQV